MRGPAPQFSLGKSFPAFGPIGPELVTVDEFDDPDDLQIACEVNGRPVQRARTSELIFSVPELVSRLSAIITLYPGDLIFTGTPAGVGHARTPPEYLRPGDELTSTIEGIGTLHNHCVAP
jgi:2-keto-4-pentenoate hydratase/2-oxohepta-3-ene-1,7-dioic acid hydratase in catechol pathway